VRDLVTIHPVPNEDEVRQILKMLLGDKLVISRTEKPGPATDDRGLVAVFIDDENVPVTACLGDLHFAAYAGSALTRIPAAGAEDAVKSGEIPETMLGNFHEIMNICSRLFMHGSSPHLRLDRVYPSAAALPEKVGKLLESVGGRLDLRVDVPGYGTGQVAFLST
jgi:hypothetical protein